MIIAFTGFLQSGKTTAAKAIKAERLSFAAEIKEIASFFQWNGKKDIRGRKLLQDIGKIGRDYNPHIWLDIVESLIQGMEIADEECNTNTVVTLDDLRFTNEATMLKKYGAIIIKIVREGYNGDGTETEQGIPDSFVDYVIENSGTIKELQNKVLSVLR